VSTLKGSIFLAPIEIRPCSAGGAPALLAQAPADGSSPRGVEVAAMGAHLVRNKMRVLVPNTMGTAGWELLKAREDVEATAFANSISTADFRAILETYSEVNGVILGLTRFGADECARARGLKVVARIGVGYDTIDVPALSSQHIPLMVVGTANSTSVAEQAVFFMTALAKRSAELHALVHTGGWDERFKVVPIELAGKTVLIIGLGRIGTRTATRCQAMEMTVLVYDPYIGSDVIAAAGYEPVADLDTALPRADFVTIHCPKTRETTGLIGAARLGRLKPTAYVVNTARGGIIDEGALEVALKNGQLAGAALDVFDTEPAPADHPLLKLPNVLTSPHMAGVTRESIDRMAAQAVRNVLSVLDGRPIRENVVNQDVLD
jgi:D-3-phosphoglycerate dehydrogenase / 2-oxoglutarate reductase